MSTDERRAAQTESERRARRQHIRLQRVGMSAISYALQLVLAAVIALLGEVKPMAVLGMRSSRLRSWRCSTQSFVAA